MFYEYCEPVTHYVIRAFQEQLRTKSRVYGGLLDQLRTLASTNEQALYDSEVTGKRVAFCARWALRYIQATMPPVQEMRAPTPAECQLLTEQDIETCLTALDLIHQEINASSAEYTIVDDPDHVQPGQLNLAQLVDLGRVATQVVRLLDAVRRYTQGERNARIEIGLIFFHCLEDAKKTADERVAIIEALLNVR